MSVAPSSGPWSRKQCSTRSARTTAWAPAGRDSSAIACSSVSARGATGRAAAPIPAQPTQLRPAAGAGGEGLRGRSGGPPA
ncbi:hypothetical protein GCM10022630_29260 [Thermobifida alba]